ncbi:patatin-like phospholipase family protein [Microcoleus sp. AT8-B1]|uniref:patatin-like phospholipase family protein n=1 Tax=unclassified Microcoleus TaxID=2642155 RepID=UPI002FD5B453
MFTHKPPKSPYNILSFDGGVIRGLLTAVLLEKLEEELQEKNPEKELKDYFDIIAGTSTGSLIACGIASGLSAKQLKGFYLENGMKIFPNFKETLKVWLGEVIQENIDFSKLDPLHLFCQEDKNDKKFMLQPFSDGKGLEEVIKSVFGCQEFGQLPKLVVIPSYDVYNHDAVIFKNYREEYKTMPVWEVCRASCAAPMAFPAHVTQNKEFLKSLKVKATTATKAGKETTIKIPDEGIPLIDGGVVANNPVLCAIAEGRKQFKDFPSVVASFGSGMALNRITVEEAKEWGSLNWVSIVKGIPMLDVLFDGSNDANDYVAKELLEGESEYFRFQPLLTENVKAFSADPDNLYLLVEIAEEFLKTKECKEDMSKLVKSLTSHHSFLDSMREVIPHLSQS